MSQKGVKPPYNTVSKTTPNKSTLKHCSSCVHIRSSKRDKNQSRSKLRGLEPKRLNSDLKFNVLRFFN